MCTTKDHAMLNDYEFSDSSHSSSGESKIMRRRSSTSSSTRSVSFSNIHVTEFSVALGDNPAVSR